jgi:hypothetical protein
MSSFVYFFYLFSAALLLSHDFARAFLCATAKKAVMSSFLYYFSFLSSALPLSNGLEGEWSS